MYATKKQFLKPKLSNTWLYVIRQMFFSQYSNLLLLANCHKVDIFIMPNHVPFNNKKMLHEKAN